MVAAKHLSTVSCSKKANSTKWKCRRFTRPALHVLQFKIRGRDNSANDVPPNDNSPVPNNSSQESRHSRTTASHCELNFQNNILYVTWNSDNLSQSKLITGLEEVLELCLVQINKQLEDFANLTHESPPFPARTHPHTDFERPSVLTSSDFHSRIKIIMFLQEVNPNVYQFFNQNIAVESDLNWAFSFSSSSKTAIAFSSSLSPRLFAVSSLPLPPLRFSSVLAFDGTFCVATYAPDSSKPIEEFVNCIAELKHCIAIAKCNSVRKFHKIVIGG